MIAEILLPALGLLLCVVLGSNNASVCFGASVGSNIVKYSFAAGIAALGVFLGMVLEGSKLSGAVFGGVLGGISFEAVLVILITSLTVFFVATYLRLPLSLSHSLIGSAVGVGLGAGIPVNWGFTLTVVLFWTLAPFVGTFVSILAFRAVIYVSHHIKNLLTLNYLYGRLTLIFSFYVSYALGANTVGLVNSLFAGCLGKQMIYSPIFGLAAAFGIFFLGRGLTEVVGREIIGLSPSTSLVAQFSSAFTVHLLTQFGLPVSITQALIGGVLGTGLAKRVVLMNMRTTARVVAGWVLAPLIGFAISYLTILNIV